MVCSLGRSAIVGGGEEREIVSSMCVRVWGKKSFFQGGKFLAEGHVTFSWKSGGQGGMQLLTFTGQVKKIQCPVAGNFLASR